MVRQWGGGDGDGYSCGVCVWCRWWGGAPANLGSNGGRATIEYFKQANRFCVRLVAKCNWLQSAKAHANRWMEVDHGNHHDQDTVVNNLPGEHSSGLWKNEGQVE